MTKITIKEKNAGDITYEVIEKNQQIYSGLSQSLRDFVIEIAQQEINFPNEIDALDPEKLKNFDVTYLKCHISGNFPVIPVLIDDGYCYDLKSIWQLDIDADGHFSLPTTEQELGEKLNIKNIIPAKFQRQALIKIIKDSKAGLNNQANKKSYTNNYSQLSNIREAFKNEPSDSDINSNSPNKSDAFKELENAVHKALNTLAPFMLKNNNPDYDLNVLKDCKEKLESSIKIVKDAFNIKQELVDLINEANDHISEIDAIINKKNSLLSNRK